MRFLTKDGQAWELPQELQQRLAEVFTGVNVEQELKEAQFWLETHPKKRKTVRGMPQFFRNWFKNARRTPQNASRANRASLAGAYVKPACPHVPACPDGTSVQICVYRTQLGEDRWRRMYPEIAGKLNG